MKAFQKIRLVSLTLALLFALPAFAQTVQSKSYGKMLKHLLSHSVKEVSVSDIADESQYVFVDAREKKEYNVSHIKDAVWCGYDDFALSRLKESSKNKKIIVYCSVGYRSEKITEKLIQAGYKDVSNLYGGIFEWKNQGRKVYDNLEKETEKVHAYNHTWGIWLTRGEKVYD